MDTTVLLNVPRCQPQFNFDEGITWKDPLIKINVLSSLQCFDACIRRETCRGFTFLTKNISSSASVTYNCELFNFVKDGERINCTDSLSCLSKEVTSQAAGFPPPWDSHKIQDAEIQWMLRDPPMLSPCPSFLLFLDSSSESHQKHISHRTNVAQKGDIKGKLLLMGEIIAAY